MGHGCILHYVLVIILFWSSLGWLGRWRGCLILMSYNGLCCPRYRLLLDANFITAHLIKSGPAKLPHILSLLVCLKLLWLSWLVCRLLDVRIFASFLHLWATHLVYPTLLEVAFWHAPIVVLSHLHHLHHLVLSVVIVPTVGQVLLHLLFSLHVAIQVDQAAGRARYRFLVLFDMLHLPLYLFPIDVRRNRQVL